jgi:hypothetical protein
MSTVRTFWDLPCRCSKKHAPETAKVIVATLLLIALAMALDANEEIFEPTLRKGDGSITLQNSTACVITTNKVFSFFVSF